MKRILIAILTTLTVEVVSAQSDNLICYIERACNYSLNGEYEESLAVWDLYLNEVQTAEGNECLHYSMGIVYKAGVLIKVERYAEAENLLSSVKIPEDEGYLNLMFLKNLGICAFQQDKYDEAITFYGKAYNMLLECKESYSEENEDNYHWCWRDELCYVALEEARVYVAKNDYINAEEVLQATLAYTRDCNELCLKYNGAGLYQIYFCELFGILEQKAIIAQQDGELDEAKKYCNALLDVIASFPEAGIVDSDLMDYVVTETNKLNPKDGRFYADAFIDAEVSTLTSWYGKVPEITKEYIISSKSLRCTYFAHLFEEIGFLDEAEYYYLQAINVLEKSNPYNEMLVQDGKYIDMANFFQVSKGDYLESLKYHYKHFSLVHHLYEDNYEFVCETFDEMVTVYCVGISSLCQYGVDGFLKLFDSEMPDLTYEQCMAILLEWRKIANEIITNSGDPYFIGLIEYHNLALRDRIEKQTDINYTSKVNAGSITENYVYQVIASVYYDRFKEYNTAICNFREKVSCKHPAYIECISNICRTLENKGYVQWSISLLEDEYNQALYNSNVKIADVLIVKLIKTALNYRLYDIAYHYMGNDIARHEAVYGEYNADIPEYTTADVYVEKLLAISWGYQDINNYEAAFKYVTIAEEVLKKNVVKFHRVWERTVYEHKSRYYLNKGDYKTAIEYQLKAVALSTDNHLEVVWPVQIYQDLAELLILDERYDDAIEILNKCVEHCRLPFEGVDGHISYVYCSLVSAYRGKRQYNEMAEAARNWYFARKSYFLNKSFSMKKNNILQVYYGERLSIFLEWNSGWALDNSQLAGLCYDIALSQKGFLLNYENVLFDNVQKSGDDELINRYNDYKNSEMSQSDSLWLFENRFLSRYAEHDEFKEQNNDITWQDVQKHLKKNDLALEFTVCYKEASTSYAALLLKKGWNAPKIIELCNESELNEIVATGSRLYKENDLAYSLIWQKLEPYFKKGCNIYFAPHGLIHQINIEVLAGTDGKPMNKKCSLYRMSSTGNIIGHKTPIYYDSATLYGGLNYDTDTTSLVAMKRNYTHTMNPSSSLLRKNVQTRVGWSYLPGTANEVKSIENILGQNNIQTLVYTGIEGTEESFKALSGNSSPIIHIATHGFYIEDKDARKLEMFRSMDEESTVRISPLKRSGLMFSGGQHAWLGKEIPSGIDDGVLTAEEIAGMNLTGTDLLVLSACQTGLGEITTEGVEGLQRGFKIAGVNTIIMSLWEVSDEATEVLMTEFYSLLVKGRTKRVAFDASVEAVRKKYKSPEYWAAFIMLD